MFHFSDASIDWTGNLYQHYTHLELVIVGEIYTHILPTVALSGIGLDVFLRLFPG